MTAMTDLRVASGNGLASRVRQILKLPEHIPFSLVQLSARLAVAHVFWKSAQTKLASWQVTQQLFAYEYNLPLLDPNTAAILGTAAELGGSIMVAVGVLARLGAAMLIGVVAVIQLFVFPQSWGEHFLWFALLLFVLARGAGAFSLDHVAEQAYRLRN